MKYSDEITEVLFVFKNDYYKVLKDIGKTPWLDYPRVKSTLLKISNNSILKNWDIVITGESDSLSIYFIGPKFVLLSMPNGGIKSNILINELEITPLRVESNDLAIMKNTEILRSRLNFKEVILINPAVKDIFPTPRFVLSISYLAAYLRKYQLANVHIIDMQLDCDSEMILTEISRLNPIVIGISINFGQLQLATNILEKITKFQDDTEVKSVLVAGNVVSSLAKKQLLNKFPNIIICDSEGELTIHELVRYSQNVITLADVPGISYISDNKITTNKITPMDINDVPLPALDTISGIISAGGAMTLELSRGCSHSACSFCPRTHKPVRWKGMSPGLVIKQLEYFDMIFHHFKNERRLYLADEEFIGWMKDSKEDDRINAIMNGVLDYNIQINFDINTRVDQIYNPLKNRNWHIKRLQMLQKCSLAGMDRVLLGVESGSDSVLLRFNKNIKSDDSVIALRLLSALGIGRRITFITFDPLMSIGELVENIKFMGRKDVYLEPVISKGISAEEIYDSIHNESFVKQYSLNKPFYENISYMLVLLDVLANCDYINILKSKEIQLDRKLFIPYDGFDINMARYRVNYENRVIGIIAKYCQLWIDRNFTLDYTLKGLHKSSGPEERNKLMQIRERYRELSFSLLSALVWIVDNDCGVTIEGSLANEISQNVKFTKSNYEEIFMYVLEFYNSKMLTIVNSLDNDLDNSFSLEHTRTLKDIIDKWRMNKTWELINP